MSNLTPEELEFENSELDDSTYSCREEAVREFIDQVPLPSPVDFKRTDCWREQVARAKRRLLRFREQCHFGDCRTNGGLRDTQTNLCGGHRFTADEL